jgi:hypothetical protein
VRSLRWIVFVAFAAVFAFAARPYLRGLAFIVRALEMQGLPRRLADAGAGDVRERAVEIPTTAAPLSARVYEPAPPRGRALLLVPPLDPGGMDAPRLIGMARQLASSGVTVVTPAIPELARFEIVPAATASIAQAALWLASDATLAPDGKVGLAGIGFTGGLAVVAAGREAIAARIAYVVSIGGHDDLPRVLKYLCTGTEPRPSNQIRLKANTTDQDPAAFVLPPSDKGIAVALLGVAPRLVPGAQLEPLRAAVIRFLETLPADEVNPPGADRHVPVLADAGKRLPEPAATLLRYLVAGDVVHLGARMLPHVSAYGADPSLSPSRSSKPSAPVFLLHDSGDRVVPEVEAEYLSEELRGHAPVRLLTSGFVSLSQDRRLPAAEMLKLAGFWGDVLSR